MTTVQTSSDWRLRYLDFLRLEAFFIEEIAILSSADTTCALLKSEGWRKAGESAVSFGARFAAIFACQVEATFELSITLALDGKYLLIRTSFPVGRPEIASWAPFFIGANRLERSIQDLWGIAFIDSPDARRWTRHQAWTHHQFPLRKDYVEENVNQASTPADSEYPFLKMEGVGVFEVPVGPVHAGIIEPGHFRFQVAGEDVLFLEERFGYVHKGIEKIAEGRDVDGLIRLASRVSGDTCVSHAWAACLACESATSLKIPDRAIFIRAIMAERERIANHIWDVAAICNDVGFAFAYYQLGRLRELWLRLNEKIFKHRLMMDQLIFGGVKQDLFEDSIEEIKKQISETEKELKEIFPLLDNNMSLQDRLKTTGILSKEIAKKMGALGFVSRASGGDFDVRRDAPYVPYHQLDLRVPTLNKGDVASRMNIRREEIFASFDLLIQLLNALPEGDIQSTDMPDFSNKEGVGVVEGWRGEIFSYVRFDESGKVSRYFPRDPSWFNWPTLEKLIYGNIVPDFPVCNKSVNASYSGQDL